MIEQSLHIVFVISYLGRGGSERQMINLASELNRRGHKAEIAVLARDGVMADEARRAGITVLNLSRKTSYAMGLLALARYLRRTKPDFVHPYLPRDNAMVTLLKPICRSTAFVWGIRSADMDWSKYRRRTRHLWRFVVRASHWADLLVANSHLGAQVHIDQGFSSSKITVIPNGIDTNVFFPNSDIRNEVRSQLGITSTSRIVGMLGRFDPMKGHDRIIDIFQSSLVQRADLHLVIVGMHSQEQANSLRKSAERAGFGDRLMVLQESDSPANLINSFDVLVLPSRSEAFPNVVAESLGCGVPVAAFDVGDVKRIVGAFGSIVPREDVQALADAVVQTVDRNFDKAELHDYVEKNFSISALADRTLQTLGSLRAGNQGR